MICCVVSFMCSSTGVWDFCGWFTCASLSFFSKNYLHSQSSKVWARANLIILKVHYFTLQYWYSLLNDKKYCILLSLYSFNNWYSMSQFLLVVAMDFIYSRTDQNKIIRCTPFLLVHKSNRDKFIRILLRMRIAILELYPEVILVTWSYLIHF